MPTATAFWIVAGYVLLFLVGLLLVALLAKRFRRKTRPPIELVYLRGPGESLKQEAARLNDKLANQLLFGFVVPPCAAMGAFGLLYVFAPTTPLRYGLAICALALTGGLGLSYCYLIRRIREIRNYELGYAGERAVAEQLAPLEREGWRVFHDIPASENGKSFNLDHVAVGPSGIAVIETKTRSKGRARKGFAEHKVKHDGRQLVWPWGEDTKCIEQANRQAKWLEEKLLELTGFAVTAKRILAIPGWWVDQTAQSAVRAVNHKSVRSAVLGDKRPILAAPQIDLIARQLESLCRDVKL